jgi:hypothetical protein
MSNHHPSGRRRSSAGSSSQRNAQLPAFCRSRSSRTLLVSVSSLRSTQRLLLLVLLFQLSTLLLVLSLLPDGLQPHLRSSIPHLLQLAGVVR